MLFSTRENLLSLYNAVNGTHYTDVAALKIVTLENAIYMNMKNDQAFLLDFILILYDINPADPICLFAFYFMWQENTNADSEPDYLFFFSGYRTNPHFIVFYNGEDSKNRKQH